MQYLSYSHCTCGAITVETDCGMYSCKKSNRHRFFPGLDLRKIKKYPDSYICNHCVNHYGLDLCACGSGEPYETCDDGYEECGQPMQKIGEYECVTANDAWLSVS